MQKAIEYKVRYGRNGKPIERHISIGAVAFTSVAGVILALNGHTVWTGVTEVCRALKWW